MWRRIRRSNAIFQKRFVCRVREFARAHTIAMEVGRGVAQMLGCSGHQPPQQKVTRGGSVAAAIACSGRTSPAMRSAHGVGGCPQTVPGVGFGWRGIWWLRSTPTVGGHDGGERVGWPYPVHGWARLPDSPLVACFGVPSGARPRHMASSCATTVCMVRGESRLRSLATSTAVEASAIEWQCPPHSQREYMSACA